MKEILQALIQALVAHAARWVLALVGEQGSAAAKFRAQVHHMARLSTGPDSHVAGLRRDSHGYRQASADEHAQLGALRMC